MPLINYTPKDLEVQVRLPYIQGRNAEIIKWFHDNVDGKNAWVYFGVVNDVQIFFFGNRDDAKKFMSVYGGTSI